MKHHKQYLDFIICIEYGPPSQDWWQFHYWPRTRDRGKTTCNTGSGSSTHSNSSMVRREPIEVCGAALLARLPKTEAEAADGKDACALRLELLSAAGSVLGGRIVSTIERPSTQRSTMSSSGTRSTRKALHSLAGSGTSNAASANDACVCENGRRKNSAAAGSVPTLRIDEEEAAASAEADDAFGVCGNALRKGTLPASVNGVAEMTRARPLRCGVLILAAKPADAAGCSDSCGVGGGGNTKPRALDENDAGVANDDCAYSCE